MNKFAALAIAAAITATAGLASTAPAEAGHRHFRGHFGIHLYAPHHGYRHRPYYGGKVCAYKWKRRWSPRRGRYIRFKRRVCWYE